MITLSKRARVAPNGKFSPSAMFKRGWRRTATQTGMLDGRPLFMRSACHASGVLTAFCMFSIRPHCLAGAAAAIGGFPSPPSKRVFRY